MTTSKVPRGRPRDPRIDAAVLAATRGLLGEVGFTGTTVQEISRRTGVHSPAIYRRWPSRLALISDAAFSDLTEIEVDPTGDLRTDLHAFVVAYERSLDNPAARAAIPGLLSEYMGTSVPSPTQWVHLSVRPQFFSILDAAHDEIDGSLDRDDVFDLVESAILGRIMVPAIRARKRPIDTTVEFVMRILSPPRSAPSRAPAPRSRTTSQPRRRREPAARTRGGT
jgi:AcrR family transcriptional regulator